MSHDPYRPETLVDLALEAEFPDLEKTMSTPPAERCPGCNLNWRLFPPAQINGLPMVRCIECKLVYDEKGTEHNDA